VQSQLHPNVGNQISPLPHREKLDQISSIESAPVVPQRYNAALKFFSPPIQLTCGKKLEGDIALFCKYEPVHIGYSSACSSRMTFRSALRGLRCPLLLPLFDMKQHSLRFQALTARYEVQSQWKGLIAQEVSI
jgi:hypothetical protein